MKGLAVVVIVLCVLGGAQGTCLSKDCASCLGEACWFCVGDVTTACVASQRDCPNGTSFALPPNAPEDCLTTTTTTPTSNSSPPPTPARSTPFFHIMFWILVGLAGVPAGILLVYALYRYVYFKIVNRIPVGFQRLYGEDAVLPERQVDLSEQDRSTGDHLTERVRICSRRGDQRVPVPPSHFFQNPLYEEEEEVLFSRNVTAVDLQQPAVVVPTTEGSGSGGGGGGCGISEE